MCRRIFAESVFMLNWHLSLYKQFLQSRGNMQMHTDGKVHMISENLVRFFAHKVAWKQILSRLQNCILISIILKKSSILHQCGIESKEESKSRSSRYFPDFILWLIRNGWDWKSKKRRKRTSAWKLHFNLKQVKCQNEWTVILRNVDIEILENSFLLKRDIQYSREQRKWVYPRYTHPPFWAYYSLKKNYVVFGSPKLLQIAFYASLFRTTKIFVGRHVIRRRYSSIRFLIMVDSWLGAGLSKRHKLPEQKSGCFNQALGLAHSV